MVLYPSAADIVEANKIALRMTLDKHPHKLLGSLGGIEHVVNEIKDHEATGLTYQAACFMKELTVRHFFAGANHRTAYLVTLQFLTQNKVSLKNEQPNAVDEFMAEIGARRIEDVQEWIEQCLI
jgi:prophage maintenance system killer protein